MPDNEDLIEYLTKYLLEKYDTLSEMRLREVVTEAVESFQEGKK